MRWWILLLLVIVTVIALSSGTKDRRRRSPGRIRNVRRSADRGSGRRGSSGRRGGRKGRRGSSGRRGGRKGRRGSSGRRGGSGRGRRGGRKGRRGSGGRRSGRKGSRGRGSGRKGSGRGRKGRGSGGRRKGSRRRRRKGRRGRGTSRRRSGRGRRGGKGKCSSIELACDSVEGMDNTCQVYGESVEKFIKANNGDVRVKLRKQTSMMNCFLGETFMYKVRKNKVEVRVSKGCGGKFVLCEKKVKNVRESKDRKVKKCSNLIYTCQSRRYKDKTCRLSGPEVARYIRRNGRDVRVKLLRQLSSSECSRGETFAFSVLKDKVDIHVSDGCRARFILCEKTYGERKEEGGNGPCSKISTRCSSWNWNGETCTLSGKRVKRFLRKNKNNVRVGIVKPLSSSPCQYGRSYSYKIGQGGVMIRVSKGCRAEFALCLKVKKTPNCVKGRMVCEAVRTGAPEGGSGKPKGSRGNIGSQRRSRKSRRGGKSRGRRSRASRRRSRKSRRGGKSRGGRSRASRRRSRKSRRGGKSRGRKSRASRRRSRKSRRGGKSRGRKSRASRRRRSRKSRRGGKSRGRKSRASRRRSRKSRRGGKSRGRRSRASRRRRSRKSRRGGKSRGRKSRASRRRRSRKSRRGGKSRGRRSRPSRRRSRKSRRGGKSRGRKSRASRRRSRKSRRGGKSRGRKSRASRRRRSRKSRRGGKSRGRKSRASRRRSRKSRRGGKSRGRRSRASRRRRSRKSRRGGKSRGRKSRASRRRRSRKSRRGGKSRGRKSRASRRRRSRKSRRGGKSRGRKSRASRRRRSRKSRRGGKSRGRRSRASRRRRSRKSRRGGKSRGRRSRASRRRRSRKSRRGGKSRGRKSRASRRRSRKSRRGGKSRGRKSRASRRRRSRKSRRGGKSRGRRSRASRRRRSRNSRRGGKSRGRKSRASRRRRSRKSRRGGKSRGRKSRASRRRRSRKSRRGGKSRGRRSRASRRRSRKSRRGAKSRGRRSRASRRRSRKSRRGGKSRGRKSRASRRRSRKSRRGGKSRGRRSRASRRRRSRKSRRGGKSRGRRSRASRRRRSRKSRRGGKSRGRKSRASRRRSRKSRRGGKSRGRRSRASRRRRSRKSRRGGKSRGRKSRASRRRRSRKSRRGGKSRGRRSRASRRRRSRKSRRGGKSRGRKSRASRRRSRKSRRGGKSRGRKSRGRKSRKSRRGRKSRGSAPGKKKFVKVPKRIPIKCRFKSDAILDLIDLYQEDVEILVTKEWSRNKCGSRFLSLMEINGPAMYVDAGLGCEADVQICRKRAMCKGPGGRYRKGKAFFKSKGCKEAHVCTGKDESKPLDDEKDGCSAKKNLVCDPNENECVCARGFMPRGRSKNGFVKKCKGRPKDDSSNCDAPFRRSTAGGCYYVSDIKVSRAVAEKQCKRMGAQLAIFDGIGSGCQRLRSLRFKGRRMIQRDRYIVGGLLNTGKPENGKFDKVEVERRRKFARRCGGFIPRRFRNDRRSRDFDGDEAEDTIGQGVVADFEESDDGGLSISPFDVKMRFICELSASTVDTSDYAWSDWIPAWGKGGNQFWRLGRIMRRKRKARKLGACSFPMDIECRTLKPEVDIAIGDSNAAGLKLNKALSLSGKKSGLVCKKKKNGKACPNIECRVFCPGGNGNCAKNNDCRKNRVCKDIARGHKCVRKPKKNGNCKHEFEFECGAISKTFSGGKCMGSGDPHYLTFDSCYLPTNKKGRVEKIDFMGVCKYLMAGCKTNDCPEKFEVIADNWKRLKGKGTKPSWTRGLIFRGCNTEIIIGQTPGLPGAAGIPYFEVNGKPDCPSRCTDCYSCKRSGRFVECTTRFGVQFAFDGDRTIWVKVDKSYSAKMLGICGNFNGNGPDDFKLRNGEDAPGANSRERERALGQQWIMPMFDEDDASCQDNPEPPPILEECAGDLLTAAKAKDACGLILDETVFKLTEGANREQMMDSCVVDYCNTKDFKVICDQLEAMDDLSKDEDPLAPSVWREKTGGKCPLPACGENEENTLFDCNPSCTDLENSECTEPVKKLGCHCKEGYVLSYNKCVKPSKCGCMLDEGGYVVLGGDAFINCNTKVTCSPGETEDDPPQLKTETVNLCRPDECDNNKCRCGRGRRKKGKGCEDKPDTNECPDGFMKIKHLCLTRIALKKQWIDAGKLCALEADTATLFRLDSEADKNILEEFIRKQIEEKTLLGKRGRKKLGRRKGRKGRKGRRGRGRGRSGRKGRRGRGRGRSGRKGRRGRGSGRSGRKGRRGRGSGRSGRKGRRGRGSGRSGRKGRRGRGSGRSGRKGRRGRGSGRSGRKGRRGRGSGRSGRKGRRGRGSGRSGRKGRRGRGSGRSGRKGRRGRGSGRSGRKGRRGRGSGRSGRKGRRGRGSGRSGRKGRRGRGSGRSGRKGRRGRGSRRSGGKRRKGRRGGRRRKGRKRRGRKKARKPRRKGPKRKKGKGGKKRRRRRRRRRQRGGKGKGRRRRRCHKLPKTVHLWIGGCVEGSHGRKSPFTSKSLLTSLDMPNLDLGAFTTGCMQVVYNTRSRTFEYKTDKPDALKLAVCAVDPTRDIKPKCSPKVKPLPIKNGAALTIEQLADYARNQPQDGALFCKHPLSIKCYDPAGEQVMGGGGIVCNLRKGFKCKGSDCMKYSIEVCCPESENVCELFPNACSSTETCRPLYYAHMCDCAKGYSRDSDGQCVDLDGQCKCGCSGDPHCYTCGGVFFDFMGVCRYIAITNKCPNKPDMYPFVEVITKHRPCGNPSKKVTCTEELTVRVCANSDKKRRDDCIVSTMRTHQFVKCETKYDGDNWMINSIGTRFTGNRCAFKGLGLEISISGSKWNSVIDKRYRDKMCGLCTDWNTRGSYGLIDYKGTEFNFQMKEQKRKINGEYKQVMRMNRADSTTFGDEWVWHDPNNKTCQRGSGTVTGDGCTEEQMEAAKKDCSFFTVLGELLDSDDYHDEWDGCAEDVCSGMGEEAICVALTNYISRKALAMNLPKIPNWRNREGSPCPLVCKGEYERSSQGIYRQQFCGNSPEGEIEDCVCEAGAKFDQRAGRCVLDSQCSCEVPDTKSRMMPGDERYNVKDCQVKYSCVDGVVYAAESGVSPFATCTETEITGCQDGYDGDGYDCAVSGTSCPSDWMTTEDGCIKMIPEMVDWPLAAERCREMGAELMPVNTDDDLVNILALLLPVPLEEFEELYVAGVCGNDNLPEVEKLQDGSVPGGAAYIRPAGFDKCDSSMSNGDPQCLVVLSSDGENFEVDVGSPNCREKKKFICSKKKDEDYEWTPTCNSNSPSGGSPDEETYEQMEEKECPTCQYPRNIACERVSDGSTSADNDGGVCNIEDFFIGSCTEGTCDDYQVKLLCPKKIDECALGVDMCDGEGTDCDDTDVGYRCECGPGTTKVIREGTAECAPKAKCTMEQTSDGQPLSVTQFGKKDIDKIIFDESCAFNLVSTKDCSATSDPPYEFEIAYFNMATEGYSQHVMITVDEGSKKYRIFPNGMITVNGNPCAPSVTDIEYSIEMLSQSKYRFKTSDEEIKCLFVGDKDLSIFTKIECTASDSYNPSCGVCTPSGDSPSSPDAINAFFEANRIESQSCVGGEVDTGPKVEITPEVKSTQAAAPPTTAAPTGTTPAPPPPPCNNPSCDKVWEAFANCGDATAIKFVEMCNEMLCADGDLCSFVKKLITELESAYSDNRQDETCKSLDDVTAAVESMRTLTGCAPKDCGVNMEVEFGATETQPTCLNPNVPQDSSEDTDIIFDAMCVCGEGMVLNVQTDSPEAEVDCIPIEDCGCMYEGKYYEKGSTRTENEDCTGLVTCVSRDKWEAGAEDQCVDNARCTENHECVCTEGYKGDGYKSCAKVVDYPSQECYELYDEESEKMRTKCICKMGYAASCEKCVDIDECNDPKLNNCGNNAKCVNLPGSFECECLEGYQQDPTNPAKCIDVPECSAESNPCPENSVCKEVPGTFICKCCEGYIRKENGGKCELRDESNVPPHCCVCTSPACLGNDNGEPDSGCYTDTEAGGEQTSYDSFNTAFIDRCLKSLTFKEANFEHKDCPDPSKAVSTTTPGALPETTTPLPDTSPVRVPCKDTDVCTLPEDKASGEVCDSGPNIRYANLCRFKIAMCKKSSDHKVPENLEYITGKCPQTTRPPTTTQSTPEFIFHPWGNWGTCSATECGPDKGIQTRMRQFDRRSSASGQPERSQYVQKRSCSRKDCEPATTAPITEEVPSNCAGVVCPKEDWDPVCGKLGDDDQKTFASQCVLKSAACRSNVERPYTVLYKGECKGDEPEPQPPTQCTKGPQFRTLNFTGTHGDMSCYFDPVEMASCDDLLCVGGPSGTDAAQCCRAADFEEEEVILSGLCTDNTFRELRMKVPTKCKCVEGG